MCGIAGGFNVPRGKIEQMCAHQSSRGPDFSGIKEIGNVIFGHTRLSIIDKSERSNQPIENYDGSLLMTYNGEVYNFDLEYSSDTRWIINTGIDLNHLNGMFAYAVYNRHEEEITLVRDRFGIKPLYYTHQKDF